MSPTPEANERLRKARRGEQWTQETGFPIIASAIARLYRADLDNFISKREIVPLLLDETHSRALVETAYKKIGRDRKSSIEKYAGNMVQWFSQKWTIGDPKWLGLFKRLLGVSLE
jgi:hypothetical protein